MASHTSASASGGQAAEGSAVGSISGLRRRAGIVAAASASRIDSEHAGQPDGDVAARAQPRVQRPAGQLRPGHDPDRLGERAQPGTQRAQAAAVLVIQRDRVQRARNAIDAETITPLPDGNRRLPSSRTSTMGASDHASRDLLADARAHGFLKLRRAPEYSGRA
jgi:hypothetical protein